MMSRHARKLVCLVGGTVAVSAVAGFYFAKSGRLGPEPRAQLLRIKFNGEDKDYAMLIDQAECRKLLKKQSQDFQHIFDEARRENSKGPIPAVGFECVPEDDQSVWAEWRAATRTRGKWQGCDVYYYHEPEPQTLAGAFVLALPNENDQNNGEPEIDEIFVDQRTCDTQLASNKGSWKSDLDYQRDAEHDPKLKATIPNMERTFKEDRRAFSGACIPIANAMPLVNRLCEGLPLMLAVLGGEGIYSCDRNIVRPAGESAVERGRAYLMAHPDEIPDIAGPPAPLQTGR